MKVSRTMMCAGALALAMAAPLAATAGIKSGAAIGQEGSTARVDVSVLNMQAESGQAAAYVMLRRAARDVCDVAGVRELGSLQRAMERRQCYMDSLESAVKRLDEMGAGRSNVES